MLPLAFPPTVAVRREGSKVDLIEDADLTHECCGTLSLVSITDDTAFHVQNLTVPPPAPFVHDDLRWMWEARNRLALRRRAPLSGDASWSTTALSDELRLRLDQLPHAVNMANRLLARWPTRPAIREELLPIDRKGGRENLLGTALVGSRLGGIDYQGRRLPIRTVRIFGAAEPRRCGSVSAIAELLYARADSFLARPEGLPDAADRHRVLAPLAGVAGAAAMARGQVDGPPSTWPTEMQRFYSLAAIAVTELSILGPGEGTAPLSEVWELYQAWAAEDVLAGVEQLFGPPDEQDAGSLLGRWSTARSVVELHYLPTIPAAPGKSFAVCGTALYAAIGDLEPDILLAARTEGKTRLLVLDPKQRPYLQPGTVSVEASKYLWGMRGDATLLGVYLIAPNGGSNSLRPEGRAWSVEARPSGTALPRASVGRWIAELTASTEVL